MDLMIDVALSVLAFFHILAMYHRGKYVKDFGMCVFHATIAIILAMIVLWR